MFDIVRQGERDFVRDGDVFVPVREEEEPCTNDLHFHRMTVERDGGPVEYLRDHDMRAEGEA